MQFINKVNLCLIIAVIISYIPVIRTVTVTYSSTLTTRHPLYTRYNGGSDRYYYEVIQVSVSVSGYFTFTSSSNEDIYGFIYSDYFNSNSPSSYLLTWDDDNGNNDQFYMKPYLESNSIYYMVVTTYLKTTTGSFSVTVSGNSGITFTLITGAPSTTQRTTTRKTTTTTTTSQSTTTTTSASTTTSTSTTTSVSTTTTTVTTTTASTTTTTTTTTVSVTTTTTVTKTTQTTTTLTTATTTTETTATSTTATTATTTTATTTTTTTITTTTTTSTTTSTSQTSTTTTVTTTTPEALSTKEILTTTPDQDTSMPITTIKETTTTTSHPTTTTATTSLRCSSPIITLTPDSTALNSPAQYRKSQDFSISSNIVLDCPVSLSIIVKWTIGNCTPICSSLIQLNRSVITTSTELFIPARTLDYGVYELKITVQMTASSRLSSSASAFVSITQSGITANLVPLGTSIITTGDEKDLLLDPGTYSIDPDSITFNASDWNYAYFCRPYDLYNPNNSVSIQSIDHVNHQCFLNRSGNGSAVKYNSTISSNSSVTILAGSLTSNQTYQFQVFMINRRNSSFQATGYVIVKVENTKPQLIGVGCVISTMCSPNLEYQFVNPTTQVALFSICIGNCTSLWKIQWNIYEGSSDSSTDIFIWTPFTQMSSYDNQLFGMDTTNLTVTNDLFLQNSQISYWRFEVVYFFLLENSSSALNFIINQPPRDGYCSIDPPNGTTTTLFTIDCLEWIDEDGIKDYSFHAWATDPANSVMLASTTESSIQLRLPTDGTSTSSINIIIYIRDILNGVTQFDIYSVVIVPDLEITNALIDVLQLSNTTTINIDPIIRLLSDGNQNTIAQTLTSISQILNGINQQNIENAVLYGVPASSISVSSLGSYSLPMSTEPFNNSAVIEFNQQLNKQANALDYLISFSTNLTINTAANIKLQASTLAKLTEQTNQLTRKTLMLASTKCQQLANALQSMANKISYEDVQIAATYITQCGTNVLTAVNGPLQDRGATLDLDFTRANAFPDDYDTDLESEWANQRLFADGDDFSWETIQRGRNNYYQKQQANIIANQVNEIFSSVTAALNIHLNIGQGIKIDTPSVFVSLETATIESLSNKIISQVGKAQIRLPSIINSDVNENSSISLRSIMQPLASADKSQSETYTNLSTSITFSVLHENGSEIAIHTNINQPIEIIIPRDPNVIIPSMILQNVTSSNNHNQSFYLHFLNLTTNNNLTKSFHLEMNPFNTNLSYLFIYNFDNAPQLNISITLLDGYSLFCPSNLTRKNLYTYFIDNQRVSNHQSIIFGFRELNSSENEQFCSNKSINNSFPMIFTKPFNFSSNYGLRTYTSGCYYLDSNNNWKSDGLIVGSLTNYYETQCFSSHLTTFAAGFLALPAPINWNYVFSNADFMKNKTIYLTVICISIIYIILIIYSRFKDKKDLNKLGITALPDNHKVDRYFYQIVVFTGNRKGSGTKSKVHFVLGGDDDETNVRTFIDPRRKVLQRGGIDTFIMAVPKSLGSLNYLRVWHDNTGQKISASWFLKYVIVRDLQTMVKSHFICQQWFAVEKGDGAIERLLPVAGDYQKQQFGYQLSKQAYHSLSENHLWFSIFSRPASNKFTRVQRCTCCFVLLFLTMFFNILYYDQSKESRAIKSGPGLSIGPLYITPDQIGTGIIVELLSLIPSLLLVQFFRRTKQRPSKENEFSLLQQTLINLKGHKKTYVQSDKKKKFSLKFPWWCLFIAYGISFICIGISIFFTIVRGIEFGDVKIQKWLVSLVFGFFSSICFTQPIKVVCLVMFFAFFTRNPNSDKDIGGLAEDDDEVGLSDDEEQLRSIQNKTLYISRSRKPVNCLDARELREARNLRLKEIKTWSIIRQIISYLCFLSILYVITYSNRNYDAAIQVKHLRNFFLNYQDEAHDYTKITTVDQYWKWLEESFIENIRAQKWYNGDAPRNLSGFINDKSNRLIGWATMRQLRIKTDSCRVYPSIQSLNITCKSGYSLFNEEKHSFQPGWINQTTTKRNSNSSIENAFIHKTNEELDTYMYVGDHETYGSGGYVYEFRGRLSELRNNLSILHDFEWIDEKTRAVIIQLTLYNPNVEMFTSVILLAEFLATGGVFPSARFEPLNFQDFTSLFQLVIACIYMSFIVYFMIGEIRSFLHLKRKYFYQFWCYVEWIIIGCSWVAVGIYILRYREINRINNLFRETNGSAYINLQFAAYINDILVYLFGFCCFFGTVKCLRFCRFDQRLSLLGDTLKYAWKDLVSFTFMFAIMFIAFVILFNLRFSSKIWACSNFLHTTQMLFEIILMKFDVTDIYTADSFFGPFYFTLFIFCVVFIAMTMFISIISDSFRMIRNNNQQSFDADNDMFDFMWKKFLRWTGINKLNEWELHNEWDTRMRPTYTDTIQCFPEKIDEFLQALDRIYQS